MKINEIRKTKHNNTLIIRDDGDITVIYQETPIVTFDDNEVILDCGGWRTRSTQSRMNWASEEYALAYRIRRKGREWFVDYQGTTYPFNSDRILLDRKTGQVASLD